MEYDQSEKIMRAKLENAAVPPPPFVWEGVVRELERKRRRPIMYWFYGALLLGTITTVVVLWQTEHSVPTLVQQSAAPSGKGASLGENKPQSTTKVPELAVSVPMLPKSGTVSAQIQSSATTNQAGKPTSSVATSQAYNIENITATNVATKGQVALPSVPTLAPAMDAPFLPTNVAIAPLGAEKTQLETSTDAVLKTSLALLPGKKTLMPAINRLPNLQRLPYPKHTRTGQTRFNLDERREAWFLDVYAGPLMAQKTLNVSAPENEAYRQLRLDTEGRGWGFNAGVRATRLFRGNWMVATGLDYRQFTETFKFEEHLQLHQVIEPGGPSGATFGHTKYLRYNRYGFVNLPIMVGYEWRKGRLGLQARLGTALNVYFWRTGSILSPTTLSPTRFDQLGNGGQEVFKSRAGAQAQASAQAFWQFRRDTRVFVEPFCETSLNTLTLSNFPTTQRYQQYGLKLGLTKLF
jgi:hypothetical protein